MKVEVISLTNVMVGYNLGTPLEKKVLSDINLTLFAGETVGIVGASGSGKTTLAGVMAGLIPQTSGKINTPGIGPGRVGLLFQYSEKQLFCDSVFDDVTYTLREVLGYTPEEVEAGYRDACMKVGLDPDAVRNLNTRSLSTGERRRIALAGLLAMNPEVLILDEPTAGLDPSGKKLLRRELRRLAGLGKTLVLISHDMEDFTGGGIGRFICLNGGRILSDGDLQSLAGRMAADETMRPMLPFATRLLLALKERGLAVREDLLDPKAAAEEIFRAVNPVKKE